MMPEQNAVLPLNLRDVLIKQLHDLLKGSGNFSKKVATYFFPVGKFCGFQSPVFNLLNHRSTGAAW